MDRKSLGLLTTGHFLVDLSQGMVPPLLPFLMADLHLSYAAAGGLALATSAASSVVQPAFGYLADRTAFRWLLPISVLVTGVALVLGAQSSDYYLLAAALAISGLGVAAFHPEAARQAILAGGARRSTGMSVFGVGGSLGFAAAPVFTAVVVVHLGRAGLLMLLVPIAVVVVLIARRFGRPAIARSSRRHGRHRPRERDNWRAFLVLCAVTITRSVVAIGITYFLAPYWIAHWGASPTEGSMVLALYLGTGIGGTLLGGWVADRHGQRAPVRIGFAVAAVLLPLVLIAGKVWAVALFLPLAVAFYAPGSVMVVLGQEYLPNRAGVASGVTLGLAVSVGGTIAPALGWLADHHGVGVVLIVLEGVLVVATLLTFALPRPGQWRGKVSSELAARRCAANQ